MLRQISWQEFLLFLSIVLGLVYLYIGIKFGLPYYIARRKGDMRQRMPGKVGTNNVGTADTINGIAVSGTAKGKASGDFQVLDKIIADLKMAIAKAVKDGVAREDLIDVIRVRLEEARHYKGTGFGKAIYNAINRTLASFTMDGLSEEEAEKIWS